MPAPKPARAEEMIDRAARVVAQALAEAMVAGNEDAVTVLFSLPANLDGREVTSAAELRRSWGAVLARPEVRRLELQQIEVISRAQARERYGPPPARLGDLPDSDALVAIIRFDRAQLVAVLAYREGRWSVVALTD